jgi:hypothetical protein
MKKAILFTALAVLFAHGAMAFGQAAGDGFSLEVQNAERRLLQGLAPAQLQMIQQARALFEGLPDSGADPQGLLDGICSSTGIKGMAARDAAFLVMAMAARDMDADVCEIVKEMNAMTAARKKMQAQLLELDHLIAGGTGQSPAAPGRKVRTSAAGAAPAAGPKMLPASLRTAHFKIEYWQAPLVEARDWRALSGQERIAAAGALQARLDALEGLLARMSAQAGRGTERRSQFKLSLEGFESKLPPQHER